MPAFKIDDLPLRPLWRPADVGTKTDFIVIVLHGRGDSAAGWNTLQSELNIPGLSALLLTAPDPYYTGFSWYDLPPNQLPGIQRSSALLENLFSVIHERGYPPEKCFLLGFSQGCLMTLEFGGRYRKRLAGYIGLSGYVYSTDSLIKEASPEALRGEWLVTHGTEDEVLPVERTRAQIEILSKNGFKIDYREYPKTHTLDHDRELPDIREWIRARMK